MGWRYAAAAAWLAARAASTAAGEAADPESLADAVPLELLSPGGATDETALVFVRL
ncbi:hypothetical protein ACIQ7Q_17825 [Streptomyces sp. NPDC096176]|uniref:hypothetical protein n=1 Tax=Streptomyces sp. NPDC096176 TaxID=3366079 RepID=UPI0037F3F90E